MLNRVTIIGNLGKEPEMKYTANGSAVTTFSVASSYKPAEGKEQTEWFTVVCWNKLAEVCAQHLAKGRKVYVDGRLQTRSWDGPDGAKKYRTEVIANQVLFLDRASGDKESAVYAGPASDIDPDDLPFYN